MGKAVPKEEQVKEEYLVWSKIPSQAVRGSWGWRGHLKVYWNLRWDENVLLTLSFQTTKRPLKLLQTHSYRVVQLDNFRLEMMQNPARK